MFLNFNYDTSYSKDYGNSSNKLRELLDLTNDESNKRRVDPIDYLSSKYNLSKGSVPQIDDLIRLIQTTENMNQQLLNENKYLKEEINVTKANALKLIEENTNLHGELRNVTIHEILNELNNETTGDYEARHDYEAQLKQKDEEIHQCQLLINDLQTKLDISKNNQIPLTNQAQIKEQNDDYIDDNDIKNRQIDKLKIENEQLKKSLDYFKTKLEESKSIESDTNMQINKFDSVVKHLEGELKQKEIEKSKFQQEKLTFKMRIEQLIVEHNETLCYEKNVLETEYETKISNLNKQIQNNENIITNNETLIDRLTREKCTISNELNEYKSKYNSIDVDTHQMIEKLRNQYREIVKERDSLLYENKRIRHDYDLYVKENDQDKYCLRDELNNTRTRLLEVERDLLESKEACVTLSTEINRLQCEIISSKHAKETLENSRNENLTRLTQKYKKREAELVHGITHLQNIHCLKVKELEDLTDAQKSLLEKLKDECKDLNCQLETLEHKYRQEISELSVQVEEYRSKSLKYEQHCREYEDQARKHNDLHERMKERLREQSLKMQEQHDELQRRSNNEQLLQNTNYKLGQDLALVRKQLALFSIPNKMDLYLK